VKDDDLIKKTLDHLRWRLAQIEEALAFLERRQALPTTPARSKRGRKSMGAEERLAVSERFKRYWENERLKRGTPGESARG
jgi:hypothetical protein